MRRHQLSLPIGTSRTQHGTGNTRRSNSFGWTEQTIAERMARAIAGSKKKKGSATDAWHGFFATLEFDLMHAKAADHLTIDFVNGDTSTVSATELYEYIFESGKPYVVTANGTIFRTDVKAIIPGLLERWYAERSVMKADAFKYTLMSKGVQINDDLRSKLNE